LPPVELVEAMCGGRKFELVGNPLKEGLILLNPLVNAFGILAT
jgi:hypothetical protein